MELLTTSNPFESDRNVNRKLICITYDDTVAEKVFTGQVTHEYLSPDPGEETDLTAGVNCDFDFLNI